MPTATKSEIAEQRVGWLCDDSREFLSLADEFRLCALGDQIGKGSVANSADHKDQAIYAANAAILRQDEEQDRDADHDRNFAAQELQLHYHRKDQRAGADDQADVSDVRADHIAHRDIGVARERRLQADQQLRRGCAIGDNRQADHNWRDAQRLRQTRCAFHQPIAAKKQTCQTDCDPDHIEKHMRAIHLLRALQKSRRLS
jgi:hypothetical protein